MGQDVSEVHSERVLNRLEKVLAPKAFLLVYDNVPVLYNLEKSDKVLEALFPKKGKGHFLLTTQNASDVWDSFSL